MVPAAPVAPGAPVAPDLEFRSRLEERWAQFFARNGMDYAYETMHVSLSPEKTYSPDFLLPDVVCAGGRGVAIEIKPAVPLLEEQRKAEGFVEATRGILPLAVVFREPSPPYPRRGQQYDRTQRYRFDRYGTTVYSWANGAVQITHGAVFCREADGRVALRVPRGSRDTAWEDLAYEEDGEAEARPQSA